MRRSLILLILITVTGSLLAVFRPLAMNSDLQVNKTDPESVEIKVEGFGEAIGVKAMVGAGNNRVVIFAADQTESNLRNLRGFAVTRKFAKTTSNAILPENAGWVHDADAIWLGQPNSVSLTGGKATFGILAIAYSPAGKNTIAFSLAKFDRDGARLGNLKQIREISPPPGRSIDAGWITSGLGETSVGVAFSASFSTPSATVRGSEGYFAEFGFDLERIGKFAKMKIKKDCRLQPFQPHLRSGQWLVPASLVIISGDNLVGNRMLVGAPGKKVKFKTLAGDKQKLTNHTSTLLDSTYSAASFVPFQIQSPTATEPEVRPLLVEHRTILPKANNRDQFTCDYRIYSVDNSGKKAASPERLSVESWQTKAGEDESLSFLHQGCTRVLPLDNGQFAFTVWKNFEENGAGPSANGVAAEARYIEYYNSRVTLRDDFGFKVATFSLEEFATRVVAGADSDRVKAQRFVAMIRRMEQLHMIDYQRDRASATQTFIGVLSTFTGSPSEGGSEGS